ncbi:MAG: hypothetical protein ABI261_06430 [Ginsengibacter sp.]
MTASIFGLSCVHNSGNTNIQYKETEHSYSMKADFPENETKEVEEYMNRTIGTINNMSFINTEIDGSLSLDDHTIVYIKKSPGILYITLDKDRNSDESYQEIKSMCQGIKKVLGK